jgi:CheY-like chemotaxis protein
LSDLSMPGQSGYELMQRVATRVDAPPAAAMTAHATKEGRERALAAGFQLYLGKPLESAELVETVAVLAGRRLTASPFPLH